MPEEKWKGSTRWRSITIRLPDGQHLLLRLCLLKQAKTLQQWVEEQVAAELAKEPENALRP